MSNITKDQIKVLTKPFEKKDIKQRDGGFGRKLDYIEGYRVIQVLNEAFGHDWSFNINTKEVISDCAVVEAQITACGITKTGIGGKKVMKRKGSTEYLDIGNDFKAATTDALKKCATLFGVALDLYGADESKTDKEEVPEEDLTRPAEDNQKKAIEKLAGMKKADLTKLLKGKKVATVNDLNYGQAQDLIKELNTI